MRSTPSVGIQVRPGPRLPSRCWPSPTARCARPDPASRYLATRTSVNSGIRRRRAAAGSESRPELRQYDPARSRLPAARRAIAAQHGDRQGAPDGRSGRGPPRTALGRRPITTILSSLARIGFSRKLPTTIRPRLRAPIAMGMPIRYLAAGGGGGHRPSTGRTRSITWPTTPRTGAIPGYGGSTRSAAGWIKVAQARRSAQAAPRLQ